MNHKVVPFWPIYFQEAAQSVCVHLFEFHHREEKAPFHITPIEDVGVAASLGSSRTKRASYTSIASWLTAGASPGTQANQLEGR